MLKKLIYLWLAFSLIACQNLHPSRYVEVDTVNTKVDTNLNGNFKLVNLIPDSLRTPEQKQLIKDLGLIITKYVRIKNNHMVFTLTKSEFVAKGFPAQYYDQIQTNLHDNNEYIDKNGVKDLDKKWEETVQMFNDANQ